MKSEGFLKDVVWGVAVGIGGRIGWGIVGWLLDILSKAVHS